MSIIVILSAIGACVFGCPNPPSETIGETKIVDGMEYWNMGDLKGQDNWRYMGPAIPKYFINVFEEEGRVSYSLSEFEDEDAVRSEGFYDKESAEERLKQYGVQKEVRCDA